MNWKSIKAFAIFVVVVLIANWFSSWLLPVLEPVLGGFGFIGSAILFLIPLYILWYALRRFVFKRQG